MRSQSDFRHDATPPLGKRRDKTAQLIREFREPKHVRFTAYGPGGATGRLNNCSERPSLNAGILLDKHRWIRYAAAFGIPKIGTHEPPAADTTARPVLAPLP